MKEVCFFSCTKSERIKGSSAYKAEGPFLVWRKKEPGNMWEVVDKKERNQKERNARLNKTRREVKMKKMRRVLGMLTAVILCITSIPVPAAARQQRANWRSLCKY